MTEEEAITWMPVYVPTAADLLEMSLHTFGEHAEELRSKVSEMSEEQRAALVRICKHIAEMEAYEPVR